jgi:integrase
MPKKKAVKAVVGPTPEQFVAILKRLEAPVTEIDFRNKAIIYMLAFLGFRRNEVSSIDMEHVDVKSKRIWILRKGKAERVWKTIPDGTWKCIEDWLSIRGMEDGPLFLNYDPVKKGSGRYTASSMWRMVRQLGKDVGIENLHPHAFRHFSITEVLELTDGNILHAQKHSGHSDPRMLNVYEDARVDVAGQMASLIEDKYTKIKHKKS